MGSIAVLEGLRFLQQDDVGDLFGYRPVLDARRYDEYIAGLHHQRLGILHFDAKLAIPTKKQLILEVVMPGELTFESSNPNDRIVDRHEIGGLPRPFERANRRSYRYRTIFHSVSVMTG